MENKSSFCPLLLEKTRKKRGKRGKYSFCSFDTNLVHVFGPFAVEIKNHIVLYHAAKTAKKRGKKEKIKFLEF